MMPTDDAGLIPAKYRDFMDVFSKAMVETLPLYQSIDHAIDLEPCYNWAYGQI